MFESFNTFWSQMIYAVKHIGISDVIDIIAVAFILYECIKFFRDSRAGQLIKGIILILVIFILANWFDLIIFLIFYSYC